MTYNNYMSLSKGQVAHQPINGRLPKGNENMKVLKTLAEIKVDLGNNESQVKKGVYLLEDNSFLWMTFTQTGTCKQLKTALKKAKLPLCLAV